MDIPDISYDLPEGIELQTVYPNDGNAVEVKDLDEAAIYCKRNPGMPCYLEVTDEVHFYCMAIQHPTQGLMLGYHHDLQVLFQAAIEAKQAGQGVILHV